jgi:dienelactone hydrolase
MLTRKAANESHAPILRGLLRVIALSVFSAAVNTAAIASTRASGTDLKIETTPRELLGSEQADIYQKILAPDKPVSWQVYLPANDTAEKPGVLVYVSPMDSGEIDSRWREVMDRQNLIYISANDMGNEIPTIRRMVMANLAIQALAKNHVFDPGRIYVSGFSGGGKVASLLATQYPEVFTGAIYICGVYFWKEDQTPNVERVLRNRFVFLSGSKDFNRMQTRRIQQRYIAAGATHTHLVIVPGMAHRRPDADYLTEAILFLDGRGAEVDE